MKNNKKMKKISGNPAKRAAQMKAMMNNTNLCSFVKKTFEKACSVPTYGGRLLINRGNGCWTYNESFNNNDAVDFMEKIKPDFVSLIKSGKMTTAENLAAMMVAHKAHKTTGNFLDWNNFVVRVENEQPIRGRWWAMKGDEFNKAHKDIPMTFSADDVIICDVCPQH